MASNHILDRVRVGGSGFTIFHWRGKPLAFARQVAHTSPEPVGPGPVAIQPMDARRPVQVITPAATGMGTITLEMYDLYGAQVWERLAGLAGTTDLVDIFMRVSALADPIHMTKVIQPPTLQGIDFGASGSFYTETYHNCVITNVQNGEQIEIGTMEILKQITVAYTNMTLSRSTSVNSEGQIVFGG
jgi:hypothetical protein